jgi:TolA-binding protein
MVGTIPAKERFLKISKREHEAQDLLYLGEYYLNTGKKDEALPALKQVVEKYSDTTYAADARKRIEQAK